ncbi:CAP domain-containing protein [Patescibacteria group bacterium]|nr:CAP domain-containing protein [Patescibacteria group bacterium]
MKNKKTKQPLSYVKTLALILVELGLSMAVVAISPAGALASNSGLIGQEEAIVNLTNQLRSRTGVNALTIDNRLMISAKNKALDMATRNYFDHVNPDGHRMVYWMADAGYKHSLAGENLAKGFTSVDRLMSAWTNSFSHYVNLVEPKFKNIGVGIAEGMYKGQTTVFVVQHFGAEQGSTAKIAGDQQVAIRNLISPITNIIVDNRVALAAPTSTDEDLGLNATAKSESIDAVSNEVKTDPPSTGGSSEWSMLGLLAVAVLAILGYLREQFSILQIRKAIFLRRVSK